MCNLFVLAFLYKGDDVLLVRRRNQEFGSGLYSLIGGKVELSETALHAIEREVQEETGIAISQSSFSLVHALHRKGTETEFIALCFKADVTNLPDPVNNEPEKHDDMRFFNVQRLPENILPAHKQIIECIHKNVIYSEHGWF
jgi:8-oxo-dGTP pyrophosphatase MutT (NUDIX family)